MMDDSPAGGKVAILVKTFPKLSETFVLAEILELERRGLRLHVFSLSPADGPRSHPQTAQVAAAVDYVPEACGANLPTLLGQHLKLLLCRPLTYLATLWFAIRSQEPSSREMFLQAGFLAQRLKAAQIVHVHAHFANYPVGAAELVHRLVGVPYSISAHAKDIFLSSSESLRRKIRGARFTATCTEYNRRHLLDIAGKDARILRIYHGMDAKRFRPSVAPSEITTSLGPPTILSVGRLREKKGFPVLIEACRLLRDEGTAYRCQIVGEGPERQRLAELIDHAGLQDQVELVGKLFHDELIDLYRKATVFVLPCQIARDGDRDGLPNVLLEAMAMQLPVVSTDVSAIPEAVRNGENGILVAQQNPRALASAIRELLSRPTERARYGKAARDTVEHCFSPSLNMQPLYELLHGASRRDGDPFKTPPNAKRGLADAN